MIHTVRDSLRSLATRAEGGDFTPLAGLHGYSAQAAQGFRPAAVLALFTPTSPTHEAHEAHDDPEALRTAAPPERIGADLFLVQRSPWLRHHPGQIALPGGALESADAGPEAAAVRETEEETGISPNRIEVLGALPTVLLPVSSFTVTPVLGWASWVPPVTRVEQSEVLHTLRIPVDALLDPRARSTIVHGDHSSPGFRVESGWVWGFTAMVLDHLFTQLGWTRPWDTSVSYPMSWDEARGAQLIDDAPSPD